MKIINRKFLLLLAAFLYAASLISEPLAHEHFEEDHAEESCLVCHFYDVSSFDDLNVFSLNTQFNNDFEGISNNSFQNTHSSPYSSRAPPRI